MPSTNDVSTLKRGRTLTGTVVVDNGIVEVVEVVVVVAGIVVVAGGTVVTGAGATVVAAKVGGGPLYGISRATVVVGATVVVVVVEVVVVEVVVVEVVVVDEVVEGTAVVGTAVVHVGADSEMEFPCMDDSGGIIPSQTVVTGPQVR